MLPLLEHFSVAVSAISGALAGRGRRVDIFGVLVLSLVTAVGGGTIRDICLGATPVFWIKNSSNVWTAVIAGAVTFAVARRRDLPMRFLEIADAVGLALFAMMGASKALLFDATGFAAIALGTVTGVAGGLIRDVLINELPMVFRREIRLYATAAIAGCGMLVALRTWLPGLGTTWPIVAGATVTLTMRLAAIRWELALPEFEDRRTPKPSPASVEDQK